jgi:hypothetical protein
MDNTGLEALVGNLFKVGGRALNSAPPGAFAIAPPRRAARGRDLDTLFGLLAIPTDQHQPASLYEQVSNDLTGKYFSLPGSITSALRDAIANANSYLRSLASRQQFEAGLVCAVLREHELIIAIVGPATCLLIHAEGVTRLPGDNTQDEFNYPLGAREEAAIQFYHQPVSDGDFVILTDHTLSLLPDSLFLDTSKSGDLPGLISHLRAVAPDFSAAQVIQLVTPLEESSAAEPDRIETAAPVPEVSEQRTSAPRSQMPEAPDPASFSDGSHLPAGKRMQRNAAIGLGQMLGGLYGFLARILPDQQGDNPLEDQLQLAPSIQLAIVAGVAIVVAVLTTGIYLWRGETSQYATLVRQAQTEVELARSVSGDQASARPHWETAAALFEQAKAIRQPNPDLAAMHGEALAALDAYDHVTRINPVLLREYPAGSTLRGPVVQGLNLYVIDTTQDILYREDLDANATTLVNPQSQVITRQGELIGTQVVSGLIDLVWMEDGGVPQKNVLAVLSRNGLLITYSPSWATSATPLPGFEAWVDPRAIAIYNRDLYILDAGANEIWRYQALDDSYSSLPQRYFTDSTPALADALDMEIDSNGNLYILHASGIVQKYFFGREQPFTFEGLPQPIARPTAFSLSLGLFDRSFFIADAGGGRLFSTSTTGVFLTNYKDSENTVFNTISGVFYQDRPPVVFFTSGNRLYYFPRPQ